MKDRDCARGQALGAFVTDDTTMPSAYSISAAADGYVYVFTPEGKLHDKFDSQGLNPLKAY